MNEGPLIEAPELATHLSEPAWVVVDSRFDLADARAGERAYAESHVPGARYAHLDRDLSRPPGTAEGRHPLPDPDVFAQRLGEWGISNDSWVAVYDDGPGAIAARLWWMLRWLGHERAVVLNGGWNAWQAGGWPTEQRSPSVSAARYVPRTVRREWVVASADLLRLQAEGALIADARTAARFRGEHEPLDPVAGHVPGARNFPYTNDLDAGGRFHSAAELRRRYTQLLGGRAASDLVAMCGSGVTACHLLLGLRAAGLGDGRLYAGSWSEWLRDPARPVATGAED